MDRRTRGLYGGSIICLSRNGPSTPSLLSPFVRKHTTVHRCPPWSRWVVVGRTHHLPSHTTAFHHTTYHHYSTTSQPPQLPTEPDTGPVSYYKRTSNRMHVLENAQGFQALTLDPERPFIVRLDGNSFSTFTRAFNRPFDDRVSEAMKNTTRDLMQKFSAVSAYTCSDEITLLFPVRRDVSKPNLPAYEHLFNGRLVKVASIFAGVASARFNHHLSRSKWDSSNEAQMITAATAGFACFDARAFSIDENNCAESFVWRILDCMRNSQSLFARRYIAEKFLTCQPNHVALQMVAEQYGAHWDTAVSEHHKYGTFFKRLLREETFHLAKFGTNVQAMRTRLISSTSLLHYLVTTLGAQQHKQQHSEQLLLGNASRFCLAKHINSHAVLSPADGGIPKNAKAAKKLQKQNLKKAIGDSVLPSSAQSQQQQQQQHRYQQYYTADECEAFDLFASHFKETDNNNNNSNSNSINKNNSNSINNNDNNIDNNNTSNNNNTTTTTTATTPIATTNRLHDYC
eukprot:TRINITY_DN4012_c0_g1_i1.p1 TRINITY_DN4012_c0_g1~~TRINITY_DN4012_c0_g1_i1.p1  ORF type:complete len:513 (+),score=114.86 TRINITY_DN4012_c0_g1_i1:5-1543(+)